MKSLLVGGQQAVLTTVFLDNNTHYQGFGLCAGGITEANVQLKIVLAGTIRNMRMYVPANGATVTSVVYFRKNGADSGPTFSYTSAQTGEKEDTSNTSTIAADDLINIRVTIPSVAGSVYMQTSNFQVEFEPTDRTKTLTVFMAGPTTANLTTASVTRYCPWYDNINWTNTTDIMSVGLYDGGTATRWSSNATAVRATATTRQIVVNGVNSTTHQNSHTTTGWMHDDSTSTLSGGDTIGNSGTTGTGTDTYTAGAAYLQIVNGNGKWTAAMNDASVVSGSAAGTFYFQCGGGLNNISAVEANDERRFRHASIAEYLWVNLATNGTTGGNTDFTFRKNSVSQTGLQCRYTTGQTGIKSDTASISIASGDLVCIELIVGTGGTVSLRSMSVGFNSTLAITTTGTLAATEAQDTAAISGTAYTVITGTLAETEAQDTAAISGSVTAGGTTITGTLAATDAPDVAAITGVYIQNITGTLVATEAQDIATINGVSYTVITGTLEATEAQDIAAIAGSVSTGSSLITGSLDATEAQDVAALAGLAYTVITGTLAATEGQDTASIQGIYIQNITGTLNATEAQDIAAIVGTTSGAPTVSWIDGVGHSGVSGSGVVNVAYTDAGAVASAVSQTKMDSTVRRWKA